MSAEFEEADIDRVGLKKLRVGLMQQRVGLKKQRVGLLRTRKCDVRKNLAREGVKEEA